MITWVLTEEPTDEVVLAIEIMENRVGSEAEVQWLCPGPVAEPIQD